MLHGAFTRVWSEKNYYPAVEDGLYTVFSKYLLCITDVCFFTNTHNYLGKEAEMPEEGSMCTHVKFLES